MLLDWKNELFFVGKEIYITFIIAIAQSNPSLTYVVFLPIIKFK